METEKINFHSPFFPTSHPLPLPNATNKVNTLTTRFGFDSARSFCYLPSSLSENGSPDTDTNIPWPLRTVNGSEYQSLRGAGDSFLTGWHSFRSSPLLFLAAASDFDGGKKRRKKKWEDSVYGGYSLAMLAPVDFISKSLSPNTGLGSAALQHRSTSIKKLTMHQPSQGSRVKVNH